VPARQGAHATAEVAPTAADAVPGPQSEHDVDPDALEYAPAGHATHADAEAPPASARNVPFGHATQRDAPGASLNEPGAQTSHSRLPENAAYEPALQFAHASAAETQPTLTPIVPRGHSAVHDACPGKGLYDEKSHGAHVAFEDAPVMGDAVPAMHGSHCAPEADEYVPALQGLHAAGENPPVTGLYAPAGHAMHEIIDVAPEVGPYVPAGHSVAIPLLQYEPRAQTSHATAPIELNVPSAHGGQNVAPDALE